MSTVPNAAATTARIRLSKDVILDVSRCPSCPDSVWNEAGQCPTCGLDRAIVLQQLRFGTARYEEARTAALEGDFYVARRLLREAREAGFDHPMLQRLDAFCAVAVGDAVIPAALPLKWQEAVTTADWQATYADARQDAEAGRWKTALANIESVAAAAPWFLPAQKLRLLCLAGVGRNAEAEAAREQLLAQFPADGDLRHYHFLTPSSPSSPPHKQPWLTTLFPVGYAMALLMVFALGLKLGMVRQNAPSAPVTALASPRASASVAVVATVAPTISVQRTPPKPTPTASPQSIIAPHLQKELQENRTERDLELARRWFNRAVAAKRQHRPTTARRLARAAYRLAPDSYLAEDALLLQAQAAEQEGDASGAEAIYRQLVERFPASPYAPVSLVQAAQAARQQGSFERAKAYSAALQDRYHASPEAARLRRLKAAPPRSP